MGFFDRFKKRNKSEPQAPKHGEASPVKPKAVAMPVADKGKTEKPVAKKGEPTAAPIVRGATAVDYRKGHHAAINE